MGSVHANFVKSYQFVLIPANLKRFQTKFLKKFVYTTKFCPTRDNSCRLYMDSIQKFFDANEQLSHTVSLYSKSGRTYAKFIFSNDCLDTRNLRALRRFILVHAFSEMLTMCSSQLQVFEKVSSRYLCEGVSPIITPSIDIGGGKLSIFSEKTTKTMFYLG